MKVTEQTVVRWTEELAAARAAAQTAARAIRDEFGKRNILSYKGRYDVQVRADVLAQRIIVDHLSQRFAQHSIVSEEGMQDHWLDSALTWVVDPLDGTNNFGYGIAHCAISICLFDAMTPVLAMVFDPILGREFQATCELPYPKQHGLPVPMGRATVAFVADYSVEGRLVGRGIEGVLSENCKRVTTMWAPALDLALIAAGNIDAMVCRNANLIDVCAGLFLVQSSGGSVIGLDGTDFTLTKNLYSAPVSFIAARDAVLARQLLAVVLLCEGW